MKPISTVTTKRITFVEEDCCVCGIAFHIPEWLHLRCFQRGDPFWCPAGHQQSYTKPENQLLRERVARLESRATHLEDQRLAAERSANAYKGQVTQLRKRVANGVCPCCHRTFANVARHMNTKHPDYQDQAV